MIPFRFATLAVALLPMTSTVFAADAKPATAPAEETQVTMEAITVNGNWLNNPNEQKVIEHPGARSIIERKRLQETGATSLRDALSQVPGIQVQDSSGTGGSEVSLNMGVRGLSSRLSPRSTVLMDGVPMAFAPYGQPQLSLAPVSLGNIDAIDVIRGAGSVRFGPQNVGGIINFVTRKIPENFAAEVGVGSEFASQGGGTKVTPNVFIGGTNDKGLGGALLYSGTHGNGFRGANDRTDINDVMLKGAYRISKTDDIAVALHHYEGEAAMPGGLTTAQYAADPFQSTRKYDSFNGRRSDASIKYTHNDGTNNFELLSYYTTSFRNSNIEVPSGNQMSMNGSPREYNTFAIEPRYSRLFAGKTVVQEVSVGYRYLTENSSESVLKSANYTPGSVNPLSIALPMTQNSSGGTKAHAFYIDDRIDVGNWTVTPGVRYEMIDTHNTMRTLNAAGNVTSSTSPSIKSNEALPTLSVLYRINDAWSVFSNAGVSFGPQQYNQLARVNSAGQAVSSLDGLHPEKATTYEIGTHYNGQSWTGEVTLFNINFDKELQFQRDGVDGVWTDLGATRHRGLESAFTYDLDQLSPALKGVTVLGSYTYTDAIQKAGAFSGLDLPYYSNHVASLGARYQRAQWTFNGDVNYQSKQRSPGTGTTYVTAESTDGKLGDIPSVVTTNVRAAYDFGKTSNNMKLALGIKNLFDRRYYTRSTDNNGGKFVGQPRTLFVQATYAY